MATRIEKDSLGERPVPADAYYGIQTQRAIDNFPVSGLRANPRLIEAYALIKKAAALVHRELGVLDAERAGAIVRAADEVLDGKLGDQFVVDVFQAGAGVSFHMNVNEVLANRALEILGAGRGEYSRLHPNDHVNMSQSTNDTFPTAMHLATLLAWGDLRPVLVELAVAFHAKGDEFATLVKSGRTHLKDAVPVTLGQEFDAWGAAIDRSVRFLDAAVDDLRELPIGGNAAGTGINLPDGYRPAIVRRLSELTGFELRPAEDPREQIQSRQGIAAVSAICPAFGIPSVRRKIVSIDDFASPSRPPGADGPAKVKARSIGS